MLRKLVGILVGALCLAPLAAREFSVFYIASANGTLSWCRCPEDPYGGLPRRASAIKDVTDTLSNLLILDAGDLLAPFPSRQKDSVFLEAYAQIPVDAVALGDQEFIEGYDFFAADIKNKMPLISANVYMNGERLLPAYIIKEVGGVKVVITSVINKDAFLFYEEADLGGIKVRDPAEVLGSLMPELKKMADVLILLSHLGYAREKEIAREFSDIDIIVSGQSPAFLPEPFQINRTYILGSGTDAKYFGTARFRLDGDSLALIANHVQALSDVYAEAPQIQRMVAPYIGEEVEVDSAMLGKDSVNSDTSSASGFKPVQIDLFYAPDCDHCIRMLEGYLPRLAGQYPGLFRLELHNIDNLEEYYLLEEMEGEAGDPDNEIPVLFFEGLVLGGEEEITDSLERLLLSLRPGYSSADSARYSQAETGWEVDTVSSKDSLESGDLHKREIIFFSTYGCEECDRVLSLLKGLAGRDSTLAIRKYSTEKPQDKALLAAFNEVYGVPEERWLLTPAVFVGTGYLVQEDITASNLTTLLEDEKGTSIPWDEIAQAQKKGGKKIIERFKEFRVLPIIGAGLLDGINPCAFATLIFFITYLSVLGVKRRRIAAVAIPFIASIFVTYFLLGFLAYQVLALLSVLRWVSVVIVAATVVLLLVLAVYSFYDFAQLRKGKGSKVKLKLPDKIRRRLNQIIRKRTTFGGIVLGALVTGFLVSVFELICTGQVYLPTLVYVVQVSEMRARALLYLLIYNLAFIVPLVVVFVLVRFGMSEKHFQTFLSRHAALTKVLTALLFLVLAGLMIFFLIRGII